MHCIGYILSYTLTDIDTDYLILTNADTDIWNI